MKDIRPMDWFISEQNERNKIRDEQKNKKTYKLIKNHYYNNKKFNCKYIVCTTIAVCSLGVIFISPLLTIKKSNENVEQIEIIEVDNKMLNLPDKIELPVCELNYIEKEQPVCELNYIEKEQPLEYSYLENYEINEEISKSTIDLFIKYGNQYGVDPNILIAQAIQESRLNHAKCLPDGNLYNGSAVGILQIENPDGREISAYNYITNEIDKINITIENACSIDTNIKIGAMELQNCLKKEDGNIFLAIQAYNYNYQMVDIAISRYARDLDTSVNDIRNNINDIGWMYYIHDIHNNPKNYLTKWDYETYGDDNYINKVINNCNTNIIKYQYNNKEYFVNLSEYDFINYDKINISNQK